MPLNNLIPPFTITPPVRPEFAGMFDRAMGSTGGELDQLFGELTRAVTSANKEAADTKQALQKAVGAPGGTVDPIAQALALAAGNAASLFTGQPGGRQTAHEAINAEQVNIAQRRKENLSLLEDAYSRAADRAGKMNDFEAQHKFLAKVDSVQKAQEQINKLMLASAEVTGREQLQHQEFEQRRQLQKEEFDFRKLLGEATSQADFARQIVVEDMRSKGDIAQELIRQGLDPSDPTGNTTLPKSKAQQISTAPTRGFLTTNQYSIRFAALANSTNLGKPNFKGTAFLNRYLSDELPPQVQYAADPQRWFDDLMEMPDPNKKDAPIVPRNSKGEPQDVWGRKIVAYMKKYWPEFNPEVAAIDSVGR